MDTPRLTEFCSKYGRFEVDGVNVEVTETPEHVQIGFAVPVWM